MSGWVRFLFMFELEKSISEEIEFVGGEIALGFKMELDKDENDDENNDEVNDKRKRGPNNVHGLIEEFKNHDFDEYFKEMKGAG